MENSGAERRKHARLDLALVVSYKVTGEVPQPTDLREGLSGDISLGGIRLMTPSPLKNGTVLELDIVLMKGKTIAAEGEVVWQNKISQTSYETGVVIKNMPNADKKVFMEFVFDQMAKVVSG